ncbi:GNAT family N-acetyltransferase [Burkholderia sp. D-99]|uniref:GNAT family N-acetyltransferase n=1 Tax=Burkholderia sp. D-99 TaxID=2717316 RepID=UPI00141FB9D5|nr:GNAT family N-acetyltransferase [Burkholderia sp. D-99]NHV28062.1 GNAT family N-acetyltransferase [Burkholderia sp. D-99]
MNESPRAPQEFLVFHEIAHGPPSTTQADGVNRLARRCVPAFRSHPELIEEKLFPRYRGPDERLMIAMRGAELVAAASFDIHTTGERRIGGIRTILVDPTFRRRGVGRQLVEAVEKSVTSRGVDRIWLYCSVPNYLYPGAAAHDLSIAHFADALGYARRVSTHDMAVDLLRLGDLRPPEGVLLRALDHAVDPACDELRAFTRREVPGFVAEVESALRRANPIAHVAYDLGTIVGFCVAGSFNAPLGAVGPAAVSSSHRGGDVFRSLVHACMLSLRQRGHGFARMQWADSRSLAFYKRWFDGFVCDQYVIPVKHVHEPGSAG